jgi:dihydroorotase
MNGVTTAFEAEFGVYPVDAWYTEREGRARINFGASVGHAAIRARVLVGGSRGPGTAVEGSEAQWLRSPAWSHAPAGPTEADAILRHLEHGIRAGGVGVGLALGYTPGARRAEVLRVFQLARQYERTLFVHARFDSLLEPDSVAAVQELIANSAATGAAMHLCHVNSTGRALQPVLLELIDGARARGVDVSTEAYPYTATSTFIGAALFDEGFTERLGVSYGDIVWVATGERLDEASFARYRAEDPAGLVIVHSMNEELVEQAIVHPGVLIASDAMPWRTGREHPRGAGTFARVLGRYVRERGALDLMDALRKMTSLPAERLGPQVPAMTRKGRIAIDADADLAVFDPQRVIDRATFDEPQQYSLGIEHVLVGGVFVVRDGELVDGVFPGQGIRGAALRQSRGPDPYRPGASSSASSRHCSIRSVSRSSSPGEQASLPACMAPALLSSAMTGSAPSGQASPAPKPSVLPAWLTTRVAPTGSRNSP